jgi:ArsR family transcriptional regulator
MHQVLHFLAQPALAIREAARILAPGGKLLIVDFAPHELEFLREEHAHDRLGFAPEQVSQWLKDAGLEPLQQRDLSPERKSGDEKLTVSLWLAEQPAATASALRKTPAHAMQEAR